MQFLLAKTQFANQSFSVVKIVVQLKLLEWENGLLLECFSFIFYKQTLILNKNLRRRYDDTE